MKNDSNSPPHVKGFNEFSRLTRVLLHPLSLTFTTQRVEEQWRTLNFTDRPDISRARDEYAQFVDLVRSSGAQIDELPGDDFLTLDAIYVRDASVASPNGMILCRMGKSAREFEPQAQRRVFQTLGIPVAGAIEPPGLLEGGDVAWLDEHTVLVGRGYRTNDEGIRQLKTLLDPEIEVVVVHLPHHRGDADVFHLMSILSPVDERLAVVYSPLMPVSLRQWLVSREFQLVEVPPDEFDAMGTNVLAIAPRRCLMVEGTPITRQRLEAAGAEVITYAGGEISLKGGGGPTCLTRPLARE